MILIDISERIRSIQLQEFLKADAQMPESHNLVFEVGTVQKPLNRVDLKILSSICHITDIWQLYGPFGTHEDIGQ